MWPPHLMNDIRNEWKHERILQTFHITQNASRALHTGLWGQVKRFRPWTLEIPSSHVCLGPMLETCLGLHDISQASLFIVHGQLDCRPHRYFACKRCSVNSVLSSSHLRPLRFWNELPCKTIEARKWYSTSASNNLLWEWSFPFSFLSPHFHSISLPFYINFLYTYSICVLFWHLLRSWTIFALQSYISYQHVNSW